MTAHNKGYFLEAIILQAPQKTAEYKKELT